MGAAGTASVFSLLILLAKSGVHTGIISVAAVLLILAGRSVRCPSQTEHHPLVRMKKMKRLTQKRKAKQPSLSFPLHEGKKLTQTVPFPAAFKQSFCFALAGLSNLGKSNHRWVGRSICTKAGSENLPSVLLSTG